MYCNEHFLQEQTRNAQFIVVSLRENMFEIADRLVGIFKTQNCTKSIAVDPSKFGRCVENNTETDKNDDPAPSVSTEVA